MKTLCVIPARGGSKRIPRKNLVTVGGIPLIYHAIMCAQCCSRINDIVVSTDDEEIASHARACGIEVPSLRPADLSTDDASSIDVCLYEMEQYAGQYNAVVLLQPTSPLRDPEDVDGAIETVDVGDVGCCVAVTPLSKAALGRICGSVYVWRRRWLVKDWQMYRWVPYEVPRSRAVDIDTYDDLAIARAIWSMRGVLNED